MYLDCFFKYHTSFEDGVSFHELGAEFFGAREVIDVDFEKML